MTGLRTSRRATVLIYLVLFLLTAYTAKTHLNKLGAQAFWDDEYTHVFAAKSLLDSGRPAMPSGWLYTRSLPYTYLVAASFSKLGVSEFSARLPSALISILTVPLIFFVARHFFGRTTGLLAAAYLAVDPISFVFGRLSRMYSLFELLFLLLVIALFKLVSKPPKPLARHLAQGRQIPRRIGWGLVALALLGASVSVHFLTLLLLPVMSVYLLVAALVNSSLDAGKRKTRLTIAIGVLAIEAVAYLATYHPAVYPLVRDNFLPPSGSTDGMIYYLAIFRNYTPLSLPLAVLGGYYSFKRRNQFGIYLATLLGSGLLIQGVLFAGWSSVRYVLHYMPLMYLLATYGLASALGDMGEISAALTARWDESAAHYALVALALALLLIYGRSEVTVKAPTLGYSEPPDYRLVFKKLRTKQGMRKGDIIVSTSPLAVLYYGGKADYWLRERNYKRYLLKNYLPAATKASTHLYTDAVLLKNRADLRALMDSSRRGWLIGDYRYENMSERMKKFIAKNMKFIESDRDILTIYRWDSE